MEFTIKQINETIKRARKLYPNQCYMGRRLNVLRSLKDQMEPPYGRKPSESQIRYLRSLMASFSDENLTKAENWAEEWKNNKELRKRGDVISKYYIANRSWFMEIARTVQSNLQNETNPIPDFHMFHKMILNEYADKVWQSHTGAPIWDIGVLVCCRANANVDGWTYQILEVDTVPITNAAKYNEKTGGCRWISINPIGTTHIFQVMEKDLKKYRRPKKRSKK